jgi:MFS family permease
MRSAGAPYRANIGRFFVFWGLVNFNLWLPIWIIFFQQRGVSLSQLGVLEAASGLLMGLAEVATGAAADRWGRKASMMVGAVAFGLAVLGLTTEMLSPVFLVAYLVWGPAYTFISGADMAFLYDSLKADGRADEHPRLAGRYFALEQASGGVAALLGGWLATVDMRLCFYASAAAMLLAAAVASTFIEPPRSEPGVADVRLRYREILRGAVAVLAGRPLVRYQILFGAAATAFWFVLVWVLLQPYARGVGAPLWTLGLIALVIRGVSFGGAMLADRVARRVGAEMVVAAAAVTMVAGQLVLWGFASSRALLVFFAVAFAAAVLRPTLSALLNREIPSAQRATILSIQSLLWCFFIAATEPVVLTIADRAGIATAVGVCGILTGLCLVPLVVLWRRALLPRDVPALVTPETGRVTRGIAP